MIDIPQIGAICESGPQQTPGWSPGDAGCTLNPFRSMEAFPGLEEETPEVGVRIVIDDIKGFVDPFGPPT